MHHDLAQFPNVDFDKIRQSIIKRYDQPTSVSICHYILKTNKVIMLYSINIYNLYLLINLNLD